MSAVTWRIDDLGEGVQIDVPDTTGMTEGTVVTIPASEVEAMCQRLRSTQLGVTSGGDL